MLTIGEDGLRKHLDERVAFWEESTLAHKVFDALLGNEINEVEAGILLEKEGRFYINVIKRKGYELSYEREIQQHDGIAIKARKPENRQDVRFYRVYFSLTT